MIFSRESAASCIDAKSSQGALSKALSSIAVGDNAAPASGWPQRLTELLGTDPIELRCICDEIRAHPEMEALVLRVSRSLSPEAAPANVEEAAIQLGVDRLRIVVRAWPSLLCAPVADLSALPSPNQQIPEVLYLAAFFSALGLGAQKSGARKHSSTFPAIFENEQQAELADILIRDFFSLLPFLDTSLARPDARASGGHAGQGAGKEWR